MWSFSSRWLRHSAGCLTSYFNSSGRYSGVVSDKSLVRCQAAFIFVVRCHLRLLVFDKRELGESIAQWLFICVILVDAEATSFRPVWIAVCDSVMLHK
ncbi:hypothetical protein BDV29DRAFT_171419 [Aspergillus leporis]|uniref:Uncharacterized protein n=1 Tax=Aspergillus leporis TaxID=41062 RepID=A0A5N5X6M4_9EURO|nr:hypothetical protein BDV29DRAFT_171419 [Aspergillus leporis]